MCNTSEIQLAATSGGRPFSAKRLDAQNATAADIFTGEGNLYGYSVYNEHSAAVFLQIFDDKAANVTVGTTVAKLSIAIPATGSINLISAVPLLKASDSTKGICCAITTTVGGSTSPASTSQLNFWYKN